MMKLFQKLSLVLYKNIFVKSFPKIFLEKSVPEVSWSSSSPLNFKPKMITIFYLIFGLVLFGIGEALLVKSELGVSPWTVLAQGLSISSGYNLGVTTFFVGAFVLLLWIPLKQKPGIGTILNIIIISFVIYASQKFLPSFDTFILKLIQAIIGVILVGISSGIYLSANLGTGPRDGLMTGLQKITNKPIAYVRICLEVFVVSIGFYLGGIVGLGTLIFAFFVGPFVSVGLFLVKNFFKKKGA